MHWHPSQLHLVKSPAAEGRSLQDSDVCVSVLRRFKGIGDVVNHRVGMKGAITQETSVARPTSDGILVSKLA